MASMDQKSAVELPGIAFCEEKFRLLDEVAAAIRELAGFQSLQLEAVIEGAPDFGRFDHVIQAAIDRKREAKYAFLRHVETHGC